MREEERIDRILDKIKIIWKRNPDWRFNQLLINCLCREDSATAWRIDDDYVENALNAVIMASQISDKPIKKEKDKKGKVKKNEDKRSTSRSKK